MFLHVIGMGGTGSYRRKCIGIWYIDSALAGGHINQLFQNLEKV